MRFVFSKLLIAISILASLPAFAQGDSAGTSGGGGAIICNDIKIGPTELMMLDFYEALFLKRGLPDTWHMPNWDDPNALRIYNALSTSGNSIDLFYRLYTWGLRAYPEFSREVKTALFEDSLTADPYSWPKKSLKPYYSDVRLSYKLPRGCIYVQVAFRKGRIVFVDPQALDQLSASQKGILIFHEVIYFIAGKAIGLNSSAPVRDFFRTAYQMMITYNDDSQYAALVGDLGEKIHAITGRSYFNQDQYRKIADAWGVVVRGNASPKAEIEIIIADIQKLILQPDLNPKELNETKKLLEILIRLKH